MRRAVTLITLLILVPGCSMHSSPPNTAAPKESSSAPAAKPSPSANDPAIKPPTKEQK